MIRRDSYFSKIKVAFESHPICSILGPRQCGKTTLAKAYAEQLPEVHIFDLENPYDLAALEVPTVTLPALQGMTVIDEIQRKPELFPYLRYLVDQYPEKKLLILGSASQELIQQSSESLAGRIAYIELSPFQVKEVDDLQKLWMRGGFPRSFLAASSSQSEIWRINYVKTFLERDLSMMGIDVAPHQMRRLWSMLSHYHGQIANISELSRSLGIADKTIKRYMDILEGCFMIRQLKPWFENISKRQVKRPKLYLRDSGLLHSLLGISGNHLFKHPKCGASWEGFALENIIHAHDQLLTEFYFWGTEKQAELDLLVIQGEKRYGYEFKYSASPKITRSMRSALEDLKLDHLTIITPGERSYALNEKVSVSNLQDVMKNFG